MRCSVAASETLDSQQNIAQPGDRGPLYGVSCSLVATSTVTRSKQQLLLLCRDHGCVRLRAAACGCVRLRATTSGARTGACWCSQGVGRRELIFRVICSVCAHTSSCGAHLRHAPTHRRGICSHSSAPQRRRRAGRLNRPRQRGGATRTCAATWSCSGERTHGGRCSSRETDGRSRAQRSEAIKSRGGGEGAEGAGGSSLCACGPVRILVCRRVAEPADVTTAATDASRLGCGTKEMASPV